MIDPSSSKQDIAKQIRDLGAQSYQSHSDRTSAQIIIDSSLLAIRQLTRRSIIEWPCHKLLRLSLKKNLPPTKIQAIDVKTVKSFINQASTSTQPLNQIQLAGLIAFEDVQIMKQIGKSDIFTDKCSGILQNYFEQWTGKVMHQIKEGLSSCQRLSVIDVAWNLASIQNIFENSKDLIYGCSTIHDILNLAKIEKKSNQDQSSKTPTCQKQKQIVQFKLLLAKLSGDIKAKVQLHKLFEGKNLELRQAMVSEERWMNCCKDLEETVLAQMKRIQTQQAENEQLEATVDALNQQLAQSQNRLRAIEGELAELEEELAKVKQPVVETCSYYINPMYEQAQMDEKILMEMIEIESDLLLGKEQIQLLTNAIVDLIKLASFSLEDLQASKYFLATFNRSAYRITKEIKSLQTIDLENLLRLKDDSHSIYDSDFCLEQSRRSQISTRSEIEIDPKLSRFTEDDSLSGIQAQ